MSAPSKSFYSSIQYCRGIAAFIVVVAHTLEHPLSVEVNMLQITGRLGVQIFFVVSGFIIATVCGSGKFSPGQFMFRRFMRVAPLYWACTLLVAFVCIVAPQVFKTTRYSLEHLLLSLAFIPHANPSDLDDFTPLLKLGWTLNYEMFFYVVMGGLFFIGKAQTRTLALTIIFVGLMIARPLLAPYGAATATYTDVTLLPFMIGVWLAAADQAGLFRKTPRHADVVLITLAIAGAALLYQVSFESVQRFPNFILLNFVAATIVGGLIQAEVKGHLFRMPLLELIGNSSYSLYLIHIFLVGAGWNVANRFIQADGLPAKIFVPLAITFTCVVAGHLMYIGAEKPLMRWSQSVSRSKSRGAAQSPT